MAKMCPGTFKARIVNYAISYTKAGDPQVEILFGYNDNDSQMVGGQDHQITYWGTFKEGKGQEWTLKNLAILGFQGKTNEDFAKLADGVEGGMLDITKDVELVLETDTKENGKTYIVIKWINEPGRRGGNFKNAVSRNEAKVKLGALNLAGQMAMVRQNMPAPTPKAPANSPEPREPGCDDGDDFDFGEI